MLKKMLIGVLLGVGLIGTGALAFDRFAPPSWTAPLAALGEHGDKGRKNKAAHLGAEHDRREKRHDRHRDDD